jgi:transcriptional regulator with XRE-family HTH domain
MTTTAAEGSEVLLSSTAAGRIRGLRAEAGMNQSQLALRVGLSRTAVSDREAGVKPVNVDELPAFAAVLGTSIEYLLGLTNDRSPRPLPGEGSDLVRHQGLEPRTRWLIDDRSVSNHPRGGQVIPLHPRRHLADGPGTEQVEQPLPAVVIPLYPARRGDVAATPAAQIDESGPVPVGAGLVTYLVDWPVAS